MYKKDDAIEIVKILKEYYPDAQCSLNFKTPFQLVVATILSAQCTDERVNQTTPTLFAQYATPEDFAQMDITELETLIHACGFYKNKAKNIKACAQKILTEFQGKVPQTAEELMSLPGVGRKTANVVMLDAFGIAQGIAVDTHAKRISNLIGLSTESDPCKIEQDLLNIFPPEYVKDINHLFVWHGRNMCIARNPKCPICPIHSYCKHFCSATPLHRKDEMYIFFIFPNTIHREVVILTNINCNANCVYQKEGKCFFNKASASILTPSSNCAYFTSINRPSNPA